MCFDVNNLNIISYLCSIIVMMAKAVWANAWQRKLISIGSEGCIAKTSWDEKDIVSDSEVIRKFESPYQWQLTNTHWIANGEGTPVWAYPFVHVSMSG